MGKSNDSSPSGRQSDLSRDYAISPGAEFSSHKISPISHNFHHHPLMQLDSLEQLAGYMMERKKCRFVSPEIKIDSPFFHQSETHDGRSLAEFFARIEEPRSWLALYNVEIHPEYQQFLLDVIASVRPMVERQQGSIFKVRGFIFMSAPPSVTPFHIDRENNFWLQIKGQKRITVFDHLDRQVVPAELIEDFIVNRSLDDVCLQQDLADRGQEFDVASGDGIYFPSTTPHMTRTSDEWVSASDGVSISIGVVFYTDHTRRVAQVHQCNTVLRKFGIKPKPPGVNPLADAIKRPLGHYLAAIKSRFREYDPPPGSY